jgi:hypothetical protein
MYQSGNPYPMVKKYGNYGLGLLHAKREKCKSSLMHKLSPLISIPPLLDK